MAEEHEQQTDVAIHALSYTDDDRDADALVAMYIEPHPSKPGVANYRLRENAGGYPIWAIIGDLAPGILTPAQVAREFHISRAALDAALVFYLRHQDIIDARIVANRMG